MWLGVVSILLTILTIQPAADPDLFARVAVGRLIEVTGGVVEQDPFAFTPRLEQWVDHEWLSGLLFYQTARWGGDTALLALDLALMAATVAVLVRAQWEAGRASLIWSALTLVPTVGIWISVVRCNVFTFFFAALLLLALLRWRNGRSAWLWLLPPCFLLWANLHGGFVAGLGLLGASAVGATLVDRRTALALWICLAASALATLVNPYGLDYWRYIVAATTRERPMISEWQTMTGWQIGLTAGLLAVVLLGSWRADRRDRPPAEAWAMMGVSLWAAADAQRLLNFLLIVLCVYGAGAYRAVVRSVMDAVPRAYGVALRRVAGTGVVAATLALLLTTASNLGAFSRRGLSYEQFPVGPIDWLDRHGVGGRVLTHFNHGSFALWRLYPRYRVAVDGRYEETYPEETVATAGLALQPLLPGHLEALARIDPDYIVVPERAWAEDFGTGWTIVYEDVGGVVLASRPELSSDREAGPRRPMWRAGF